MSGKNLATLIIFLSCSFFLHAQITKGAILLGGQIYYSATTYDYPFQKESKNNSANFNISAGKAFKENTVFGINFTYNPSSVSNYYNGNGLIDATVRSYNFGVFYRQYKKLAKDLYFFAEFSVAYVTAKQIEKDTAGTTLETVMQSGGKLGLTPGISYKIWNKLHLEILIPNIADVQDIKTSDQTHAYSSAQHQFLFNTSLNNSGFNFLGVGFKFIF